MQQIKGRLHATDISALLLFNSSIKCRVLDKIMPLITNLGGAIATISCCLLVIALGNGEVRKMGVHALAVLGISHLMVFLLKNRICRLRPKDALPNINTFNLNLDYYSFPSGHTTAAFSIAVTFILYFPLLAVICVPLAVLVAVSRMYLGVHYPSDVLAGIALAAVSTEVLNLAIKFI